jgi:hypothetical protein
MNPKKMGKIDNQKQEPWKAPLPIFIENLYYRRLVASVRTRSSRSSNAPGRSLRRKRLAATLGPHAER